MGSHYIEVGIGDPGDFGTEDSNGNIGMAKHYSFEFDDSDDSFNDSCD